MFTVYLLLTAAAFFCVTNTSPLPSPNATVVSPFLNWNGLASETNAIVRLTPKTGEALINSTITFTCITPRHLVINFALNNETVEDTSKYAWDLEELICNSDEGSYKHKKFHLKALKQLNNSIIDCHVHSGTGLFLTATSSLKIQDIPCTLDIPARVGNLNYKFLDETNVLLTWAPPNTLKSFPIINYIVNVVNFTKITTVDTYSIVTLTDATPCDEIYISVSPVNEAGEGEASFVSCYPSKIPIKSSRIIQVISSKIVSYNGSVNVTLSLTNAFSSYHKKPNEANITIEGKVYERSLDKDLKIKESVFLPATKNLFCISVDFGYKTDKKSRYILTISSVDYETQCINCTFYTSGNTDKGCQVDLMSDGKKYHSVQFLRYPHNSLMAMGCIPDDINIACYDIYIYAVLENNRLNSDSIKFKKIAECNLQLNTKDCWTYFSVPTSVLGFILIVCVVFIVVFAIVWFYMNQIKTEDQKTPARTPKNKN